MEGRTCSSAARHAESAAAFRERISSSLRGAARPLVALLPPKKGARIS